MKKRLISLVLVFCTMLSIIPTDVQSVYAREIRKESCTATLTEMARWNCWMPISWSVMRQEKRMQWKISASLKRM